MQPKVSIIVPIFNVEQYLNRCINSIVNQTIKDIEIILVDDGSSDNSLAICEEWRTKDKRIKVIHKNFNEGLGMARNSGLEICTGEYITFCDSDDYVDTETYNFVYNKMKNEDLDICWFQSCRVCINGNKYYTKTINKDLFFRGKKQIHEYLKHIISHKYSVSCCKALFKKDPLINSGIRFPDEKEISSEDLLFLIHYIPYVKNIGIIPNVYYNYFINPCSITNTYSEFKHKCLINLLYAVKHYCETNFEYAEYKIHFLSLELKIFKVILRFISRGNESFFKKLSHLSNETRHPLLNELYNVPTNTNWDIKDRLYIFFMSHHVGLFFIILYNIFYTKDKNEKSSLFSRLISILR